MKRIVILVLLSLFVSISGLKAQYNSLGYNPNTGEWNIIVHEYQYWYETDNPSLIHSFSFTIENQTGYNNITAVDLEFTLKQNNKVFYKQTMYVEISPGVNIGEVVQTKTWRMSSSINKSKFNKKTTWSARITNVYSPK